MSVCVNPYFTEFAAEQLKDSDVKVCTVVGFPLGANASAIKALEARQAVRLGAEEIDMVINIGALKEKDYNTVEQDISEVVEASGKSIVKVILETCYLTDEEIVKACKLSVEAGADYVGLDEYIDLFIMECNSFFGSNMPEISTEDFITKIFNAPFSSWIY